MARELDLEIANLVCKFGNTLNLVDLLDEVVIPAFFTDDTRSYKGTTYFFTDQQFSYLTDEDPTTLALTCRFIKSTLLTRHQIYSKTQGIIADKKSLESAPSAMVILLLNSHRLLYVREVPHAPTPAQFGSTFAHFMRQPVVAHRDALYEQAKAATAKLTRKQLKEQFEFPDITVVPIISRESLASFMSRFKVLNSLRLEVAPTNNEIDNEEFFKDLRAINTNLKADRTMVHYSSSKGLSKKSCLDHVEAAKQGNALIHMKGTDKQGDDISGNNDNFSVRAGLGVTQSSASDVVVTAAHRKYAELLGAKVVEVGKPVESVQSKIQASYQKYREGKANG